MVYFTLGLTVVWTLASLLLYRRYGDRLRQSVRRRWLDLSITLKDRSSLRVVESLLGSPEAKEVTLALELLEKAEHPSYPGRLLQGPAASEAGGARLCSRLDRARPAARGA